MTHKIYKFLSSVKLAIALLIAILVCCIIGVTIVRGEKAGALIFGTLWFNGLLVLLVLNVAFCFFPRMKGRKLTLIWFGMILFHLSFVSILGGVVYNSLFYFRGMIRLTEGETLRSGDPFSYDFYENGRYFSFSKIKGDTTLVKMHRDYKIDNQNKRAAYEIAVGEGSGKKQGVIYITEGMDYDGFRYINDKEGYSVLVILYDKMGRELYGAYVPLQSFKQKNDIYFYITGTKEGPGSFPFPQSPQDPRFLLQVAYSPDREKERAGEVLFKIHALPADKEGQPEPSSVEEKPLAEGKVAVGKKFSAGDYYLSVPEIRYWVGMMVRYEPGKPVVLASLWVGFGGIVITFIGRMIRGKRKKEGLSENEPLN